MTTQEWGTGKVIKEEEFENASKGIIQKEEWEKEHKDIKQN